MPESLEYLVVLDFEATCDRPERPNPQEIIEFPSVLLCLASGEVVAEFQEFVRPVHHPILSPFCRELTSIAQRQVNAADDFPIVLARHLEWLSAQGLDVASAGDAASPSYAVATCGDWDLLTMFPRQCATSAPAVGAIPQPYRRWVNIKEVYRQARGVRRAPGMVGMLKALDLTLIGTHHRGIDDCRNIARIVLELRAAGAEFQVTGELPVSLHPPLELSVRAGADACEVRVEQRMWHAVAAKIEAAFLRPLSHLEFEGREFKDDAGLLDLPTGVAVDAVMGATPTA